MKTCENSEGLVKCGKIFPKKEKPLFLKCRQHPVSKSCLPLQNGGKMFKVYLCTIKKYCEGWGYIVGVGEGARCTFFYKRDSI